MGRKKLPPEVWEQRRRVGLAVRTARQTAGLNLPQLAQSIDISRPYLSHIEAGRKPLTDDLAVRLSRALGIHKVSLTDPAQDVAA